MNRIILMAPFAVVIIAIVCRFLSYPQSIHCDVAMSLQEAQLILAGKCPYIDFVNIQLPLYYCLFLPVAWCSQVTGFPIILTADIFITTLVIYSIVASIVLAYGKVGDGSWPSLTCTLFSFSLCNLALFFHFGQKEHIFVLLLIPFFLLRWLRRETHIDTSTQPSYRLLTVIVGALAGVGAAIKPPFYPILPIAAEIYWLITKKHFLSRMKDPEMTAFAVPWLVYLLMFFGTLPDLAKTNFLSRWLPLILSGYGSYSCPLIDSFSVAPTEGFTLSTVWLLLPVSMLALCLRQKHSLLIPLLIWTVSGYFIYLLQRKSWSTLSIVLVVGYVALAGLELAIFAQWIWKKTGFAFSKLRFFYNDQIFTFTTYSVMLSLLLPCLITDSFSTGGFNYDGLRAAVRKYSRKGDYILVLSSFAPPAYPCQVQTERRPASRYLWTFPLRMYAFIKEKGGGSTRAANCDFEQRRIIDEINEDVKRTRPAFIAVSLDQQMWDLISMNVKCTHDREPLIPPMTTMAYWDPKWSIFSFLETHGFERVIEGYKMAGFSNGNLIWTRER